MTIKLFGKKILTGILKSLPLDAALQYSQSVSSALAKLIRFRDWGLQAYGWPQFFKHQINLSRWRFEPSCWSFTARGVFARENMFKNCLVLDLCCGDGSYSYMFFSDIALKIDAVDIDLHALTYAKKFFAAPTIYYHGLNIIEQPLPSNYDYYDVVVWNAAICYFSESEIRMILNKIILASKVGMVLCGMLPKASGYVDHKTEFKSHSSIATFLCGYFGVVTIKEVNEMQEGSNQPSIFFYFRASEPLQINNVIR